MIRICSWCRRVLDGAVAIGEPLPEGWEDTIHCEVSRALCASCFDQEFGDAARIDRLEHRVMAYDYELHDVVELVHEILATAHMPRCPHCGAAWETPDAMSLRARLGLRHSDRTCDTCPAWGGNGGPCDGGTMTGCGHCLGCEEVDDAS